MSFKKLRWKQNLKDVTKSDAWNLEHEWQHAKKLKLLN